MNILELYLSPDTDGHINIIAHRYGESRSVLPFAGRNDRRITMLKALNADYFDPKDFDGEDEQDWMVQVNLLSSNRHTFHPDMRANIGKVLYKTLFPMNSDIERFLHNVRFTLSSLSQKQLLIQLAIRANVAQEARLFDYPWELLHDGQSFLAERGIVISRYIAYEDSPPDLSPIQKINVLLVSSRAFDTKNGLKPLSEEEGQAILQGLQTAKQEGHINVKELKPATFEALEKYVLEYTGEETPHIIHFDGHGCFGILCDAIFSDGRSCRTFHFKIDATECKGCGSSLSKPQGYLLFEDELGTANYISARQIAATVGLANRSNRAGHGIALVVLSACKSSLSLIEDSVFSGVAQNLISHQIPAVVGMSFTVNAASATNFADRFYRALGKRYPLALAMNWGRDAMGFDSNQWYRPVFYLRWHDNEGGQIFASTPLRATDGNAIRSSSMLVSPLPAFNPQWLKELDASGGAVPLDSQFYVERQVDASAKEQLLRSGVTLRIKGSRQVGKTSLLARLLQHAENHAHPFIYIDFQDLEDAHFQSLDTLLHYLAYRIADEHNTNQSPDTYWQGQIHVGPKDKLTRFLLKEVLADLTSPFILVLDEVDRLFAYEHFRNDFFSLIRSWHNKRAMPQFHAWKKLNIILAYSTEAFLFISDLNQSPFNVGTDYNLTDFDRTQVELVNYKHGSPVKTGKEMDCMMSLLHGHPFLVRKAWYALAVQQFTVEDLLRRACDDDGPFEDHLRYCLLQLHKNREQSTAMKSVIQNHICPTDYLFYQLRSAGLVTGSSRTNALPRCGLYEQYFQKHL